MLATLYNKGNVQGSPPLFWSHSVVNLLHKKGHRKLSNDLSNILKSKNLPSPSCKKTDQVLTANNYINEKVQKAFLPGNNGTIEHSVVLEEIISQAKTNKKTVHVTFFDLEDAFGSVPSVPHPLILYNF